MKWKRFPRYWPFVRGIYRSPVNSLHKGQWRGVFMFSLISAWINGWVNNVEAGDLRHHRAHYGVTVMTNPMMTFIFVSLNERHSFLKVDIPFILTFIIDTLEQEFCQTDLNADVVLLSRWKMHIQLLYTYMMLVVHWMRRIGYWLFSE